MATAEFLLIDGNRTSKLFLECSYTGGTWRQEQSNPQERQMVFPTMHGVWRMEDENAGKAGKVADRVTLYSKSNDYVASFRFADFKPGVKFMGIMTPRDSFPQRVGTMYETEFWIKTVNAPPATKRFTIRQVGGGGVGYGAASLDVSYFEITDTTTNQTATYLYKGIGGGAGVGPKNIKKLPAALQREVPGSGTLKGPPNNFTAHGWRTVRDFAGDAVTGGASVAVGTSWGYTYFKFSDIHIPGFNGGSQIGLPNVALTGGKFTLVK